MTTIFLSLFGISVSISMMVLALILLTPFLNKRYAAKWKYLIWIILALRLLIPVSGVNGQSAGEMLSRVRALTEPGSEEKETDTQTNAAAGRIIVQLPAQMTAPIAGQTALQTGSPSAGITALDIVICVWMAGSLIVLSLHLVSYFRYRRQVMGAAAVIEDAHILRQLSALKQELHISHSVQAVAYPEAESPMILGFFKPVLVLPVEQYSAEELFFILKHELVHLKRGDVCFKLLFVTANAVHWWNPVIWLLQKEAAVDMELSCDERVTQGAGYAVRKAYTETLLSMLHRHCARRTVLSTQFYGGKKIMKKRFQNILTKNGKKNGVIVFLCAMILTGAVGTLVGCSVVRDDTGTTETVPDQPEQEGIVIREVPEEEALIDQAPAGTDVSDTTVLIFIKEGMEEQKQATLAVGDGYCIYLPDSEWQQSGADIWTAVANEQVQLWAAYIGNEGMSAAEQQMADEGYATIGDRRFKQTGDMIEQVILKGYGQDVWGIFCTFPVDAEEGWGSDMPVIADTFAPVIQTDAKTDSPGSEDIREIRETVDAFAAAYFDGRADAITGFLASAYKGTVETYEGTGTVSDLNVKGLSDVDGRALENGKSVVSLEFRDSSYEDMLLYLTIGFVRQEDGWKIEFYGVEG